MAAKKLYSAFALLFRVKGSYTWDMALLSELSAMLPSWQGRNGALNAQPYSPIDGDYMGTTRKSSGLLRKCSRNEQAPNCPQALGSFCRLRSLWLVSKGIQEWHSTETETPLPMGCTIWIHLTLHSLLTRGKVSTSEFGFYYRAVTLWISLPLSIPQVGLQQSARVTFCHLLGDYRSFSPKP